MEYHVTLLSDYSYQMFSAVERIYPIFELQHNGEILLDVSADDSGCIEVGFNVGCANKIVDYDQLISALEKGRALAISRLESDNE
jgi:hypothetical protein